MGKFAVFMTYGVYVDTEEALTEDNYEELQNKIISIAIDTILTRSPQELLDGDFEVEDITAEFEESNE